MADNDGGGGNGWVGFLAGIILLAIVAVGVVAYSGGFQPRETAQLELNTPDINVNPPDVNLPSPPPAPVTPPAANNDGGSTEPAPATNP